ncbi:imidazole glycerol phosphate synthase subunit HisF [Halanaerobium sp. Z-7514]|uniref:Imidazole glycerol phosphate synthase subunit HisF n=1 Tax=Halanaerobium polyolivorans TaxID=2886943 RepID=A0AAW4WXH6_9FIRM|nr:imidazole glycerol phosphate synthase subunit HisF [Halanaerobium polyolivorans]MCC3144603.1 imidazole glycerol phosphate synthase subunit HisF [Halanaerobium polyolivorans]RQD70684.1 MAG: imidazole glycerol phosphate synthase subunit HisF [Halanaerobium sp. MSAO_Bac5]
MHKKRIIPCLDIKDGRVVKGVNFVDLIDAGDPVESARKYNDLGADELVFLDITATKEKRKTLAELVEKVAAQVFIPLTVGGGIRTVEDMQLILRSGADKVSVNSAAVKNPELVKEGAQAFGSQCIVGAVDADKRDSGDGWEIFINGGSKETGIDLIEWVKDLEELGAGEILLTSINADGTKDGYDIEMLKAVTEAVNIPVIASGGAGKIKDFIDVFEETGADAALAASIFHFGEIAIKDVKKELEKAGIPVRIEE